jgi:hypothetical protein
MPSEAFGLNEQCSLLDDADGRLLFEHFISGRKEESSVRIEGSSSEHTRVGVGVNSSEDERL